MKHNCEIKNTWPEHAVIGRFEKALIKWIREKPTGEMCLKVNARSGGINRVLISIENCEYYKNEI